MDKEIFKLNVTDLMVGDWVFCYHPLSSVKARHQVTPEILDLMYRMSVGRLAEDNPTYRIIEPIPLTTQILEDLGFERRKGNRTYAKFFPDGEVLSIIENIEHRYMVSAFGIENDNRVYRTIGYVHELQHITGMLDIPLEVKQ